MSRYSCTYPRSVSGVMSGQASAKIADSGSPVIDPTRSKSSAAPPCASITRFAVSTTKRTLSVSVPSRSQRTARTRGVLATATAGRCRGHRFDGKCRLLRHTTVARFLPQTYETLELVVERVGVLETGVHDLEAQVAHRLRLGEPLEHHLTDALRLDLGRAALLDGRLDVIDE